MDRGGGSGEKKATIDMKEEICPMATHAQIQIMHFGVEYHSRNIVFSLHFSLFFWILFFHLLATYFVLFIYF